ncbi:MAG TPA: hypothetical protein EYP61_02415 [Candidatus Latescibacteria bacterium]|nr:hypothetical protein [Candidatus Latescibacterota bacterium]
MWTLLGSLILLVHSSFSEEPVAVVVSVSGRAEWREGGRAPWKLAVKGLQLYQGSELRTGTLSRAVLVFVADGSRVLVNEDTELVVEAKGLGRVPRPTGRVRMFVGEVYSKVRSGREFEVETPVSVASVRGTEFDLSHDAELELTELIVVDGFVELSNALGRALAGAYMRTTARRGEPPAPPDTLSEGEVRERTRWAERAEPKWRLDLVPEGKGKVRVGEILEVSVRAISLRTGRRDESCGVTLNPLSVDLPGVTFSMDGGHTWTTAPAVKLDGGEGRFVLKGSKEGKAHIVATAPNCAPGELTVSVVSGKERKVIELEYLDEEGRNRRLRIELEE